MEEKLLLLIQLQDIDTKIRTQVEQKNRLPEILAALERRRAAAREGLDQAKEALLSGQRNKRERDKDLEAGAQKIEKLKARIAEIKNNKEYQASLKEIEAAEKDNKAIEDDILGLMEKIDSATSAIAAAEKRTTEEDATIQAEQKQHEATFAKMEEELKIEEQLRREAASRIDPALFVQYQRLLETKSGTAIVAARGESCSGCYMSVPPQVFVNVKKNESIINCPNCGRILYYKG